ncbi:MAG: hypothetical protein ACI8S6_005435, partial [Myxococcota bacterium]
MSRLRDAATLTPIVVALGLPAVALGLWLPA